jgi:YidC/Oxa1 family membrane protein insertase
MVALFNTIIFEPLLNFLVVVTNFLPGNDLGFAIIIVTVIIRVLIYPLSGKALKSQKRLTELQPKIKEIQNKHKNDRQKQSQAIMEFYKKEGINPFAGCLPLLIQLPIIIGLYRVFLVDLSTSEINEYLYSFVAAPEVIHTNFLGLVELTQPSLVLAVLAGLSQFVLSKLTFKQRKKTGLSLDGGIQAMMVTQMTYVLPVVTVFIAQSFPAGLVLFWTATTLFSLGQQYVINIQTKS